MEADPVIRECSTAEDYAEAEAVTRAYVEWLGIDLGYQDIDREMADFAGMYGPPKGAYLLARRAGRVVGGVGLRPLGPGICEIKRLYVYPDHTGRGIGRALIERLVTRAGEMGYRAMRLDTLGHMKAARALYRSMGFVEIPPYRFNPDPATRYLELRLGQEGADT